jgi:glutamate/tyrosine decarboxylase-like PLP-dependent enzyme
MGTGTPVGIFADLLMSAMNCHVSGYDQAATLVERQVIRWLTEIMDMPAATSGVLVSGGTVANLLGLTIARNSCPGLDPRRDGVNPAKDSQLVVYGSVATHGWAVRSCDLLGLGENAFRKIAVNKHDQVDLNQMRQAIRLDRERGVRPFCIIGNAGTVATGATDDLRGLADLARREGLWFHADGAFGALAKLSPKYRHLVDGLELADSIAFDLHKWGYMQYETGAVLVRDANAHKAAFSFAPSYLEAFEGGIAVEPTEFASLGIQLSRGFRALRVWMNFSTYGTNRIGKVIQRNIEDVQYLKKKIEAEPELELLGPAEMNVVCFRYRSESNSDTDLDALNKKILVTIQETGLAVPSNARIEGRFAIRVAHTNHRTHRSDFDKLVQAVLETGRQISRIAVLEKPA